MTLNKFIDTKYFGALLLVTVLMLNVFIPAESVNSPVVYEVYDLKIDSIPGENYVAYGGLKYGRVVKEYLKRIEPQTVDRDFKYIDAVLWSIKSDLDLYLKKVNLSDHVLVTRDMHKKAYFIYVGIYDPTPEKVNMIWSKLEELRDKYLQYHKFPFSYILYRLLLPISKVNEYDEFISQIMDDPQFQEEVNKTIKGLYMYGFGLMTGGFDVDVKYPDAPIEEIEGWFRVLRKYIPEHIPIVVFLRPLNFSIIYDIEVREGVPRAGGIRAGQVRRGDSDPILGVAVLFLISFVVIILSSFLYKLVSRE